MQTTGDGEYLEVLRREAETAGNVVMEYGQHAMKPLKHIPDSYLRWLSNKWHGVKIKRSARLVLEGRRHGVVRRTDLHDMRQFPAPRSATMNEETPWQTETKRRCGSQAGFEMDMMVTRGKLEAKVDLVACDGREVILLDLRRKDDVARAEKTSTVRAGPWVILNAEGATDHPPSRDADGNWSANLTQEAQEVWNRLQHGFVCRMYLWVAGEILEPLDGEATTTCWMKTENAVLRLMMNAGRHPAVENGKTEGTATDPR